MRDRHGCWQCKGRRRKCAREQPACSECLKRGLKCKYGQRIIWQQDAVRDGTAFGRAGVQKSPNYRDEQNYYTIPVSTPTLHLINYTGHDFEDIYDTFDKDISNGKCYTTRSTSLSTLTTLSYPLSRIPLRLSPSIGTSGDTMLHYCEHSKRDNAGRTHQLTPALLGIISTDREIVCGKRVLIDGLDNPFRQLIIPISLSSEMLSHAVAAFAAHDLLNQHATPYREHHEKILYHNKCRAISLLRQQCSTETIQRSSELQRDAVLLTISFLCHLDISSGSKGQWAHHLRGSSSIIKTVRGVHQSTSFSDETQRFISGFLYTLVDFCVGETWLSPNDQQTKELLDETRAFFETCASEDSATIDPSIGLSWGLVDIIHSANRLRHKILQPSIAEVGGFILQESLALEHRLQDLIQVYDEADHSHHIFKTAEAYKEACFLFIYHGLYGHSTHSPSIRDHHLPKLMQLLEDIACQQGQLLGTFPYPMWPLFIAATFANESHRAIIMYILTIMKGYRPKSNTISAEEAIKAIWRKRDLSDGSSLGAVGLGRLEWQETLKGLGWTLGLN